MTLRSRLAAIAVGAVLVVIGVPAGWWWTHPRLFPDLDGGAESMLPRPVADAALSTAVTYPARGTVHDVVTFHGAAAHFSQNGSAATASFAICVIRPGAGPLGLGGGDLGSVCRSVRPVTTGARLDYSAGSGEYLVMTIRPTRAGTARVDRVRLDYGLGWDHLRQHGTDTVAVDVTSHAR